MGERGGGEKRKEKTYNTPRTRLYVYTLNPNFET